MRILLITQYFLPQPLANAEVVGGLAMELARMGHDVEVVTPVDARGGERLAIRRALGYFAPDRADTVHRIVEYLAFTIGALLSGLVARRPDVILVPSPPPTLGLVGVALGAVRRVPVVYNVQDLYPEVAAATGAVSMNLPLRILAGLMRFVYRQSAAVVVIDESFVPAIKKAAPKAHVVPIRNAIDRTVFAEAHRDPEFLASIGVPGDRPVIMYAGNVGRSQDLSMVAAATEGKHVDFIVHGDGAGLELLRQECAAKSWTHVHFSPYRDRSDLGLVFASADLHVVPLKAGIASASVPSKLLSIFSAGRPAIVLAEAESPAAAIVAESKGGWLVEPGDDHTLRSTIDEALRDIGELRRRGDAALRWSQANAGMDRFAREYEVVLTAAANGRSL